MSSAAPVSSVDRLTYRVRLERMYKKYDPSRVHHVDALLAKFERHEDEMMKALVEKYGPEPSPADVIHVKPCRERFKKRIYNFYKFYNPEKLGMVDDLADGYWQEGEESLMRNLIEKYGPEPMVHSDGTVRNAPKRHRGLAVSKAEAPAKPSASEEEGAQVAETKPSDCAPASCSRPETDMQATSHIVHSGDEAPSSDCSPEEPQEAAPHPVEDCGDDIETDEADIEAFLLQGAVISNHVPITVPVTVAAREQLL